MRFLKNNSLSFLTCPLALVLVACDGLSDSKSSAGQDFTSFAPNVQILPTNIVDTADLADTEDTPATTPDTPVTVPDTAATPDTTSPISTRSLAGTGIVWKPVSEGDGKLVILTPTSYGKPAVSVLDSAGKTVETGRYVGHTNGNRATYRFSRPGRGYNAPAYLKVGGSTFLVSSPANRYN